MAVDLSELDGFDIDSLLADDLAMSPSRLHLPLYDDVDNSPVVDLPTAPEFDEDVEFLPSVDFEDDQEEALKIDKTEGKDKMEEDEKTKKKKKKNESDTKEEKEEDEEKEKKDEDVEADAMPTSAGEKADKKTVEGERIEDQKSESEEEGEDGEEDDNAQAERKKRRRLPKAPDNATAKAESTKGAKPFASEESEEEEEDAGVTASSVAGVLKLPDVDIPQKHLNQWVTIYASRPTPHDLINTAHEGFLLKQGYGALGRLKYNERYFVLHEEFLYYWDVKQVPVMPDMFRGCISLQKCGLEENGTIGKQQFCFTLSPLLCGKPGKGKDKNAQKNYVLAAKSESEYEEWLAAIRGIITPRGGAVIDHEELQSRTKIALNAEKYTFKLIDAIKIGDTERVLYILSALDIDAETEDGWRAVHMAAFADQEELLRLAISSKCDMNARTRKGETPLYLCFAERRIACARILLEGGADPTGFDSPSTGRVSEQLLMIKRKVICCELSLGRELSVPPTCVPPQSMTFERDISAVTVPDDSTLQFVKSKSRGGTTIASGSFADIVDYAIDSGDEVIVETLLLTLVQIAGVGDLLAHLKGRLSGADGMTQKRIANFVEQWVKCFFEDFYQVSESLSAESVGVRKEAFQTLTKLFKKRDTFEAHVNMMKERERAAQRKVILPGMHVFSLSTGLDILNMDMRVLAEQITVYEADLYYNIRPRELVGQKYSKEGKAEHAPRVVAFINHFNHMSAWVEMTVLQQPNRADRVASINAFLELAWSLRDTQNFNAQMWLISALQSTPIFKLKKTWETLTNKSGRSVIVKECFEKMQEPAGNYKNMARLMGAAVPPAVPFLGMYLTQLTFADDGAQNTLENGDINFRKHTRIASIIKEALYFQIVPYAKIEAKPELMSFFDRLEPWDQATRRAASAEIIEKGEI